MADGPKDLRTSALTAADFDQGKEADSYEGPK
jgi:hypothetical protein